MNKRTHYPPEFKTEVVLEVLAEGQTVNQVAAKYSLSPVMISRWKKDFMERAPEIFKKGPIDAEKALSSYQEHIAELECKVGQLTYEVDWKKSTAILGPGWEKKKR